MNFAVLLLTTLGCQLTDDTATSEDPSDAGHLTAPVVAIEGTDPSSAEDLLALVLVPGESSTGGAVEHHFRWLKDGEAVSDLDDVSTVPAAQTSVEETWTLEAWAAQGDLVSDNASDQVTIGNSNPVLTATISPESPTSQDDLVVTVEASDPDGGALEIGYTWFLDQVEQPDLVEGTVPASETDRDQQWICQVVVTDEYGGQAETWLLAEISNSAPSLLGATVSPQPAYADDSLDCTPVGFEDLDGDEPSYEYMWNITTDGESCYCHADEPPSTLESAFTSKGTIADCEVTPSDGDLTGDTVYSAELVVSNSLPGPPEVAIDPSEPLAGEGLQAVITVGASDPDGDSVHYTYTWTEDGVEVSTADHIEEGITEADQTWQLSVIANDGDGDSEPAYAEVTIGDAAE